MASKRNITSHRVYLLDCPECDIELGKVWFTQKGYIYQVECIRCNWSVAVHKGKISPMPKYSARFVGRRGK